jgi:hypothetical protein
MFIIFPLGARILTMGSHPRGMPSGARLSTRTPENSGMPGRLVPLKGDQRNHSKLYRPDRCPSQVVVRAANSHVPSGYQQ